MVKAKWQRIKHPTSKLQQSIQEKHKFKKRIESLLFSYLSNNLTHFPPEKPIKKLEEGATTNITSNQLPTS